jgi:hypothetical protein
MNSLIVFDTFGETLNEKVDIGTLEKYTKGIPGVYDTFQTPRLNQKIMFDKLIEIKQNGGKECKQRRHHHELMGEPGDPLEGALEQADLHPNQLFITNIRVHADGLMLIGCVKYRCHYEKSIDHSEGQLRVVENLYKSTGGEMPVRVLKSCRSMLE